MKLIEKILLPSLMYVAVTIMGIYVVLFLWDSEAIFFLLAFFLAIILSRFIIPKLYNKNKSNTYKLIFSLIFFFCTFLVIASIILFSRLIIIYQVIF